MPHIIIIGSDGKRSSHEMKSGEAISIGRSSRNSMILADLSLSRHHAEILPDSDGWILQDAGSRNGTFLNGHRLQAPERLKAGDRIDLGGCHLEYREGGESTGRVVFSDQPMASEGTIFLPLNDVMTMPEAMVPGTTRAARSAPAPAEDMRARIRRLEVVEKANLELLGHESMDHLLPKVLDLVNKAVKPDRTALFLQEADGSLICRASRSDRPTQELSISRTIANTVLEQRVAILTSDAQVDSRFKEGASIMAQGIHSVMAVPLWNNKKVIGLIYADSRVASGLFANEDLRVLTALANIAAIQIENARLFEDQVEKRRMDQEAEAAADIQKRLLPQRPPEVPGYEFAGLNIPCYEVGGDYYDYYGIDEERYALVLADVDGKGMGAAMLMSNLQAAFHARVEMGPVPQELVSHLNNTVARVAPRNRYVTLFYLELNPKKHQVLFVNAGHAPEPMLVRAAGGVQRLQAGGVPLGIIEGFEYPVGATEMQPGDFVFICSDGVTETVNKQEDEFGEGRLEEILIGQIGHSPAEIRAAVQEGLATFAGDALQPDDLTLMIVRRTT
ncbi:MAG: SpoIIE family protein phosphatase [Acidobacteria bacterium]|nr:SpoIIE family protein phosphatase [Acidobacteriota bacterium]